MYEPSTTDVPVILWTHGIFTPRREDHARMGGCHVQQQRAPTLARYRTLPVAPVTPLIMDSVGLSVARMVAIPHHWIVRAQPTSTQCYSLRRRRHHDQPGKGGRTLPYVAIGPDVAVSLAATVKRVTIRDSACSGRRSTAGTVHRRKV